MCCNKTYHDSGINNNMICVCVKGIFHYNYKYTLTLKRFSINYNCSGHPLTFRQLA